MQEFVLLIAFAVLPVLIWNLLVHRIWLAAIGGFITTFALYFLLTHYLWSFQGQLALEAAATAVACLLVGTIVWVVRFNIVRMIRAWNFWDGKRRE